MAAEYRQGASVQAVAHAYHVDHASARRHLVLAGEAIRGVKLGIPPEELEAAQRLRSKGWTYIALAKRYGCSRTAVAKALRKATE